MYFTRRFVDNVFNEETVMDHQFITGHPRSPDKNFIESLKDAMRTVVNHKDSSKERSRAPELLAQYSDQLLRKVCSFYFEYCNKLIF